MPYQEDSQIIVESEGIPVPVSQEAAVAHVEQHIELQHVAIPIKEEVSKSDSMNNLITGESAANNSHIVQFSEKAKRSGRLAVLLICIAFLIIGRFSVPNNEVDGVQDKIMDALEFANNFINTPGNEHWRNLFQILCSLMVDIVFIITFGYWVLRGKGGRLPITLAIFYIVRALVQKVWYSPFPQGFYWDSPGMESLVVPYGRGSDFFFSGHTGFLVICALEWHKNKMAKVRNFVIGVLIYTMLILVVYRIHYSIDVFTGFFFADWCYNKVDFHKEKLDSIWAILFSKIKKFFAKKNAELP